jgi:hypothetical protein
LTQENSLAFDRMSEQLYDGYSPEVGTQPTQPTFFSQYDFEADEMILEKFDKREPEAWGRLISRSAMLPQKELFEVQVDDQGRSNLYTLGRSTKCSFQYNCCDRISNMHCIIYCKENKAVKDNHFLEAWIEDLSFNGTYINKQTRLSKNTPRLLHNGDEISLIHPDAVHIPGLGITEEHVMMSSFIILLNLKEGTAGVFRDMRSNTVQAAINRMSNRTSTIHRMLNKQRNIYDHYEVMHVLGTGTSGMVYLGVCKEDGKHWAIKSVDTRSLAMSSKSTAEDITREAEILRSLRHPNIIHLEDIFADSHSVYLVMELTSGGDLFDRLSAKGSYKEDEAREVIKQVLEAISYLHENNVAHRDLKPENILLVSKHSDTLIKITDFGLAKKIDAGSGALKSFCGTPQYLAPVCFRNID